MTIADLAWKEFALVLNGKKQESIVNEKYRVLALQGSTQTRKLKLKQNNSARSSLWKN